MNRYAIAAFAAICANFLLKDADWLQQQVWFVPISAEWLQFIAMQQLQQNWGEFSRAITVQ